MIGGKEKAEFLKLKDYDQISFKDAMIGIGLDLNSLSSVKRKVSEFLSFIELLIKQGPILE